MPFNYMPRTQLQHTRVDPNIIEQASKTPFSIAGNAMTELSDAIDNRAFEAKIGQAKRLEDLVGLTPRTEKQAFQLRNQMGIFDALQKQQQFDLTKQKTEAELGLIPLQKQKYESDLATSLLAQQQAGLEQDIKKQAFTALQDDRYATIPKDVIKAQAELPSLGIDAQPTTGFTALSTPEKIQAELALTGKSGTLEFLKESMGSLSPAKRDSLKQMEDAFAKANPNATPKQKAEFYQNAMNKLMAGASYVAGELGEKKVTADFNAVQNFKELYGTNPSKATSFDMGRMNDIEQRNYNNMDTNQKALMKKATDQMSANQVFIDGVNQVLDDHTKGEVIKPTKGIIDNSIQRVAEITGFKSDQVRNNIDFNSRTGRLLGAYMKATSGLAVTDAERQFLTKLFSGGFADNEAAIIDRMNSFQKSMIDENNILAGQWFDKAPHSVTKFRQYRTYEQFEKQTTEASNTDYSGAFR